MLTAADLGLRFGDSVALSGVNVDFADGSIVAITGPSGSGKTSLLYCLATLVAPSTGVVTWNGREISTLKAEQRATLRRQSFGFVFQSAELVPELTLRENVMLPLELLGRRPSEARSEVRAMLASLGLEEEADRRPRQVSGGQAQRAALARALIHKPAVVFADEPTGALDSRNGELVMQSLLTLARECGSTVVLVTHDPAMARRADRAVLLRDGTVVEDDAPP